MLKTGTLGKSRQVFCSRHGCKVERADLSFLNTMEVLQYRSTVWVCGKLCKETNIPNTACLPEPLFVYIMKEKCTWGRYVVYMTRLHIQFPTHGEKEWSYLNKMYHKWRYSFPFLLGQWLRYHVQKSFDLIRPHCTWFVGGECNPLPKQTDFPPKKLNSYCNKS